MHLEEDRGRCRGLVQSGLNLDHRLLHEVGRGALYGCVLRDALAELPHVPVPRLQLGNVPPPPEQRLDVAELLRGFHLRVEEVPHTLKALEVGVDECLRLLPRDAEPLREGERSLAVERREVHRLRLSAHPVRHVLDGHPENDRRGLPVHVDAFAERVHERRILAEMREHAKLDLRVIDGEKERSRVRHEALSDPAPQLRADGDVLQVRVTRRQPARRGHGLVEAGVYTSGSRIHELRQRFDVGGAQLLQLSILHHEPRHLVTHLRELLEHRCVRGRSGLRLLQDG